MTTWDWGFAQPNTGSLLSPLSSLSLCLDPTTERTVTTPPSPTHWKSRSVIPKKITLPHLRVGITPTLSRDGGFSSLPHTHTTDSPLSQPTNNSAVPPLGLPPSLPPSLTPSDYNSGNLWPADLLQLGLGPTTEIPQPAGKADPSAKKKYFSQSVSLLQLSVLSPGPTRQAPLSKQIHPNKQKHNTLCRMTCLADKTNHPVERLSLNRSQCGSCSTKYDTLAGT